MKYIYFMLLLLFIFSCKSGIEDDIIKNFEKNTGLKNKKDKFIKSNFDQSLIICTITGKEREELVKRYNFVSSREFYNSFSTGGRIDYTYEYRIIINWADSINSNYYYFKDYHVHHSYFFIEIKKSSDTLIYGECFPIYN